ncbi:MAG: FAD-dependent thymidylate synthase [Clostridiales bacterium]|jgi:thymidylate synthase (FAD)|nr:FAD-dependent thymidylate synthase [Clostridiales bacterium]
MDNKTNQSIVEIIGYTNIGERIMASAGKISTQPGDALEIFTNTADELKNTKLIKKVTSSGHLSVIEHMVFNIAFSNVSVLVEQFMIEFRLASFTVKSRRYVDFSNAGYYIPPLRSDDVNPFKAHVDKLFKGYDILTNAGIPKEDARFVLPYCFNSNFYCTVNGRELVHILIRMIRSNLPELIDINRQLVSQIETLAPSILSAYDAANGSEKALSLPLSADNASRKSDKNVELVSYTQNATELLKLSHSIMLGQDNGNFIDAIMESERPRELEQIYYTFKLNNISLSSITHIVRHRMQSIIVPSITDICPDDYILPETVVESGLSDVYKALFDDNRAYIKALKGKNYDRSVIGYLALSGNTTSVITTMNARELILFLRLRTCNRAQWEIRNFAQEMLFTLRQIAPEIFNKMGPSCYLNGFCPEGKMTCGKKTQMCEKYSKF